jgi:hypothetical protein
MFSRRFFLHFFPNFITLKTSARGSFPCSFPSLPSLSPTLPPFFYFPLSTPLPSLLPIPLSLSLYPTSPSLACTLFVFLSPLLKVSFFLSLHPLLCLLLFSSHTLIHSLSTPLYVFLSLPLKPSHTIASLVHHKERNGLDLDMLRPRPRPRPRHGKACKYLYLYHIP